MSHPRAGLRLDLQKSHFFVLVQTRLRFIRAYMVIEANNDGSIRDIEDWPISDFSDFLTDDKHLFLVFVRKDLRDIAAVEFIRHTIQCTSFPPWEDATSDLKSNIIEATPIQAEKIASHPDIVRITPIEETILEDDTECEIVPEDVSNRTVYVVRPTNRRDRDQCLAIHASLKDIFQDELQPQELGPYGVSHWKVNTTSDQVPLAAKIEGVKYVIPLEQYVLRKSDTSVSRKRRIIKPIGTDNQEQCKATDAALRNIFGGNLVRKLLHDGGICHWTAMLSSQEARRATAVEGVSSVRTAMLGRSSLDPGPHPLNVCNHK
ncbi:hypothetical protein FPANT_628 [Fusarium pseudoanthophilum]|uniref:Uncharacterized protein n=1 Tax=Fusarium pseudoanthophilum TaxID=48495 RepID=A0A8H5V4J8_9HYPO|nr:hypothetical protein FPANT_628 [Fusarium pseudoanthophilum]